MGHFRLAAETFPFSITGTAMLIKARARLAPVHALYVTSVITDHQTLVQSLLLATSAIAVIDYYTDSYSVVQCL